MNNAETEQVIGRLEEGLSSCASTVAECVALLSTDLGVLAAERLASVISTLRTSLQSAINGPRGPGSHDATLSALLLYKMGSSEAIEILLDEIRNRGPFIVLVVNELASDAGHQVGSILLECLKQTPVQEQDIIVALVEGLRASNFHIPKEEVTRLRAPDAPYAVRTLWSTDG